MSKSQDKRIAAQTQPDWVCFDCGKMFGYGVSQSSVSTHAATYHMDTCGVCFQHKSVTEPRDFGYLRPGWNEA